MKLLLGNNQSKQFIEFYENLQHKADFSFDYISYESLLFTFNVEFDNQVSVINLVHNRKITDYDAVYINNYINTLELASATAIVADHLGVPYANHEFSKPPSLSKLTEYARLASAGVKIPPTFAGTKVALLNQITQDKLINFPYVMKRADADRGVDNFKITTKTMMAKLLEEHKQRSLWVIQQFIPNDGYFRVAYNGGQAQYAIFRTLQQRPDGNELKAHMYRPKGGGNAELLSLEQIPDSVKSLSDEAVRAMDRQFAGVDCLYSAENDTAHIIEVNYNPQIVTIESFADIRQQAFLDGLKCI